MQVTHVVGLLVLVASVPLQMYLMKHNENFRELVADIVRMLPKPLQGVTIDLTDYVKAANHYLQSIYEYFDLTTPPKKEDEELPEHLVHNFRPPHLELRVGDVVLTKNMVVGAIVGWLIDKSDLTKEPVYILIAEQHEEFVQETQNNLISIESFEIKHKLITRYFETFDGTRYIPKKFLLRMYPKD